MNNLQNQIKNLEFYFNTEDFNHDAVTQTIASLNESLESVANNEFSRDELTEFLLSERDPLDNIDGVSDQFREEVREIQHAIINFYS